MNTNATDLGAELSALEQTFRQLRPRLIEIAEQLEGPGQPPVEETIAQLTQARKQFLQLRQAVVEQAVAEQVPSAPSPDQVGSLPQIAELLRHVNEARVVRIEREKQKMTCQQAAKVLDRVLVVSHRDRPEFAPLAKCQARARELRQAAETLDDRQRDELHGLAEGQHPLCDLLALLESYRVIEDERWQQLHDSIAQNFGRELAMAVVRGRLTFQGQPAAPPPPPPPPTVPQRPRADTRNTSPVGNGQDKTVVDLELPPEPVEELVEVDEDSTIVEEPPVAEHWRRGPLTAEQVAELLTPCNGVTVLFGSPLAGLDDVEDHLRSACREGRLITLDGATDRIGFLRELDELLEDRPDGLILVMVPSYCPWNEDWVKHAVQQVQRQPSKKKMTRVLFVADPPVTWYWVQMSTTVRDRLLAGGVVEHSLQPWSDAAVSQWLEEIGMRPADETVQQRISQVTGNWTLLLQQLGARCKARAQNWEEALAALEKEFCGGRSPWRNSLGVVPQALPVLKVLGEQDGPTSTADLVERLAGSRPPNMVEAVVRWAGLLRFARSEGNNKWTLDPIVRQGVGQMSEEWAP